MLLKRFRRCALFLRLTFKEIYLKIFLQTENESRTAEFCEAFPHLNDYHHFLGIPFWLIYFWENFLWIFLSLPTHVCSSSKIFMFLNLFNWKALFLKGIFMKIWGYFRYSDFFLKLSLLQRFSFVNNIRFILKNSINRFCQISIKNYNIRQAYLTLSFLFSFFDVDIFLERRKEDLLSLSLAKSKLILLLFFYV